MADMSPNKVPMPELDPDIRNKSFDEVALGYSEDMAVAEAARCLNCKNASCVAGCPVDIDIPAFIEKVKNGDFEGAYNKIAKQSSLPAVCGRVCPQERQCEGRCVRGIKGESVAIGRLERFVADYHLKNGKPSDFKIEKNGKKVAVIGSGPSGLACAGELIRLGYGVTVFEAFHIAGGVLQYGIPEFRLPKDIVNKEIENLKNMGAEFLTDMVIGKTLSLEDIMQMGFEAMFIGTGAGLPMFMGINGEGALGVYSANEFLSRVNLMKAYKENFITPIKKSKKVAVIGGGNVAMDAARVAKRLGAETVYIIYRRSEEEMPARKEEIHHAKEEGIEFKLLCNPTNILTDENEYVKGIECVKMELGEPDSSGRRSPKVVENSNFNIEVDSVIMALGTSPNPMLRTYTADLDTDKKGCFIVNEELETSIENVFAGGDAVTGAATVILAMGAGKKAANSIHKRLSK